MDKDFSIGGVDGYTQKGRLGLQQSKAEVRETRHSETNHRGQAVTVIKGRGQSFALVQQTRQNSKCVMGD